MNKTKRILYLMHVDWDWIKQRPHFIAEGLANFFSLSVIYDASWRKGALRKNETDINHFGLKSLPRRLSSYYLFQLDCFLKRLFFSVLLLTKKTDWIFIPHPMLYLYLPKFAAGKVVYDCMDDYHELKSYQDQRIHKQIMEAEKLMCQTAAAVFFTSKKLQQAVLARVGSNVHSKLIRNGYSSSQYYEQKLKPESDTKVITYIGTVAEWFDFELIYALANQFSEKTEFHIVGPLDRTINVQNAPANVIFKGVVSHDKLHEVVNDSDCLIMPFKITPLVEAVDPVKLYEYINFSKPVLSCYYDEIQRFEEYIYFYRSYQDAEIFISRLLADSLPLPYTAAEKADFLQVNSWNYRVSEMVGELELSALRKIK